MRPLAIAERLVLGGLAGLAAFGIAAMLLLLAGATLPDWLLPAALTVGLLLPWRGADLVAGAPAPPALGGGIVLLLAAVLVALVIGALGSPTRHWDGAVAWEVKAGYLAAAPTLEQPYFRDPAVFVHSRDYPLLQPLLLAGGDRLLGQGAGRLVLPLLYLLAVLLVGVALRRGGQGGTVAWLGAAAFGLTPILVNPTSGGADSGYADAFVLTCVTAAAAGLWLRDARLLGLGLLLGVLVKPEGLIYGALTVVLLWCLGERRLLAAAVGGWLLAALVWLPLQRDLQGFGQGGGKALLAGGVLALAGLILAADWCAHRMRLGRRGRTVAALLLLPVLALALPLLIVAGGNEGGTMGLYLADPGRMLRRLARLPAVVAGMTEYGLLRGGFALALWLPLLTGLLLRWRRLPLPAGRLVALLGLGLLALLTPFLFSPEEDLRHHLRSSMPRLLLHWLGAAVLLGAIQARALWTAVEAVAPAAPAGNR